MVVSIILLIIICAADTRIQITSICIPKRPTPPPDRVRRDLHRPTSTGKITCLREQARYPNHSHFFPLYRNPRSKGSCSLPDPKRHFALSPFTDFDRAFTYLHVPADR
eukprot:538910-Pleurochrysis_carterae.AAC.3